MVTITLGGNPADALLPRLREDLHVQRVGTFHDGAPRYRIHDPLRNRFFELGMFEVEILMHWDGGASAKQVAQRAGRALDVEVAPEEVLAVRDFLVRHQLVDASQGAGFGSLHEVWRKSRPHWAKWLLHHYLFFRIPLVRPDAWLARRLPLMRRLVSMPALLVLLAIAAVTPFTLAREWHAYRQSFGDLLTFDGIIACAVAAFFAKILHELGHAFVARHHGVRVPVMGVAFLVLWPMLYTDTSDSWKLADHRSRFRIAAAGIATELAIALVCLFLWTLAPPGGLRSALFFLSTTSILITLSINASPFMRFDGYFLLSDALDFPNLHERSGALARWWMHKTLWGVQAPPPEVHRPGFARFLIVFAYLTWAYRFVVFLSIAVIVYLAFFKLLGIILMVVELAWFIARPVWMEARDLWQAREKLRPRWLRLASIFGLVVGAVTLVAWSGESRAPALLLAADETRLHTPVAAQVASVEVRAGDKVRAGQVIAQLQSPDLVYRAEANAVRIERVQGELARIPATERQLQRSRVLQEELAAALSEQEAIASELALLTLRSTYDGRVVDMPGDLRPGRWVHPRQLLGRVVDTTRGQVRSWVSEAQVRRLRPGATVTFLPALPEQPRIRGKVVRIDTTGSRLLPHPLLDARNGGDLNVSVNARGEPQLRETLYQVDVEVQGSAPDSVQRGRLVVPTGPLDALAAATRHAATVLVRESGF